jgi:hypothetical protein
MQRERTYEQTARRYNANWAHRISGHERWTRLLFERAVLFSWLYPRLSISSTMLTARSKDICEVRLLVFRSIQEQGGRTRHQADQLQKRCTARMAGVVTSGSSERM